jgi:tripartite-type tricarboxylate transporter receptor subunit TctC
MKLHHWAAALGSSLLICFGSAEASAADASSFYKGKTVKLIVGFSPGGGYDQYTRTLARHYGSHIPGHPDVIVENMPGASSLKAVKYLSAAAPKDGSVVVAYNSGLITQSITLPKKMNVNLAKLPYIGSITQDIRICYMWHTSGVKTFKQMKEKPKVVFGETGRGSSAYVNESILKNAFGVHMKQVLGYPGSAEKRLAIERGELDGDCGAYTSLPEDWLRDHKINIVIRFNSIVAPGMSEDIPYDVDLVKDPDMKKVLKLFAATGEIGRPYITTPGIPKDRLAALRTAFNETVKDPKFVADAHKQRLTVISPMNGEDAQKAVAELYDVSPKVAAEAKKITGD